MEAWCAEALRPFGQTPAAHHRLLIAELQAVIRGETRRLMVNMPPGSAKSTYGSVLFPAWVLAQRDGVDMIGASNTAQMAEGFSRRVMAQVREHSTTLGYSLGREAAEQWDTTHQGRYRAVGVGGAIVGTRCDLAIIDDPTRSRADAESATVRESQWNWFTGDLRTRLKPDAAIVMIMCMTGDTLVSMGDGSQKRLRHIQSGDKIATYDDGILGTSVVEDWRSQGHDFVFEIQTESGAKTKANARHPFLVERDGRRMWVRLRDILVGDSLVRAFMIDPPMSSGDRGKACNAARRDASSERSVRVFAQSTTVECAGQKDADLHRTIAQIAGTPACVTDTALTRLVTRRSSMPRMVYAPSVETRQPERASQSIGAQNFLSTTTTLPEKSAASFATAATTSSGAVWTKQHCYARQNTSGFTPDRVIAIVAAGREEVFDVQVARTGNFIANGFVSHNTRWHVDDLGGRLLDRQPGLWRVVSLPAIAEDGDALGRAPGEWLWSDDAYGYSTELRKVHDEYEAAGATRDWAALYQQRPRTPEGALFKCGQISTIAAVPAGGITVRAWDLAATKQTGTRDPSWTTGVKMTRMPDGRFIVSDVRRLRGGPDEVEALIVNTAMQDGKGVRIGLPQDPGQAGKTQVLYLTRKLWGFVVESSPETGAKETRAAPHASQVNVGNVCVVNGSWNAAYLDELAAFPGGLHEDQVDAASRAFNMLIAPYGAATQGPLRL